MQSSLIWTWMSCPCCQSTFCSRPIKWNRMPAIRLGMSMRESHCGIYGTWNSLTCSKCGNAASSTESNATMVCRIKGHCILSWMTTIPKKKESDWASSMPWIQLTSECKTGHLSDTLFGARRCRPDGINTTEPILFPAKRGCKEYKLPSIKFVSDGPGPATMTRRLALQGVAPHRDDLRRLDMDGGITIASPPQAGPPPLEKHP
mmetsp:Transcript_22400/g.62207  ORF Transcript_22400/g.62207 Transcript_22400/m.62207 type:complete len:204 (-) Transcript_22400:401-1012(-)